MADVNLRPRFTLAFDRILAVSSASRANFKLLSGTSGNLTFLEPRTDPVERTIVFTMAPSVPALLPNTEYRLVVEDSGRPADRLAAFDGAAFAGRAVIRFTTGTDETADLDPDPTPVDPCGVASLLRRSCAEGACHAGASPVLGLSLDGDDAIAATAVDRGAVLVQRASEPSGTGEAASPFPYGLPRIARGVSGRSFVLFKALMHAQTSDARTALELGARVPGGPMPPASSRSRPLSSAEVRALRRWIDGGARPCSSDLAPPGDAGTRDATPDVAAEAARDAGVDAIGGD